MNLDYPHSALIIIDVQHDFCPGGALPVKDGKGVIGPINKMSSQFSAGRGTVIATQDWHPENHVSFASSHESMKPGDTIDTPMVKNQVLWPIHCVQGRAGAEFCEELDLKPVSCILRKGFRSSLDSYSAFFENDRITATGLDGFLKALSINTVVLGGLALDYCVFHSAMDARALGVKVIIASDAVRGADFPAGSAEMAMASLKKAGVIFIPSGDLQ